MQADEFAERIRQLLSLKTLYVKGGFGAPLTPEAKRRAIKAYPQNEKRRDKIMAASADTFAFDCCGIVKSILWGFTGDPSKTYGGARYASNGVPDLSEAGFAMSCPALYEDFSGEIPIGAGLFSKGHMGVYIGDGLSVEATPIWQGGVQRTTVANMPGAAKKGLPARTWRYWGRIKYVEYEETMTYDDFCAYMERYNNETADKPASDWAQIAIERVKTSRLMVGDPSGNFRPQSPIKREEMAVVLAGMLTDR